MSVYSNVTLSEINIWWQHYSLGKVLNFFPVLAGVTNSIYHLESEAGSFILVIFEKETKQESDFYVEVAKFYQDNLIPVPELIADSKGQILQMLKQKSALVMRYILGTEIEVPQAEHIEQVGNVLACMHQVGTKFLGRRLNPRGAAWRAVTAERLLPKLNTAEQALLNSEMDYQSMRDLHDLSRGLIHADLFRDNILFDGKTLKAVLDFDYACNDLLLLDIATTINDWCRAPEGLDKQKIENFLQAYQVCRPLQARELENLSTCCRLSALRFWLSRLVASFLEPNETVPITVKDPKDMQQLLEWLRENPILC